MTLTTERRLATLEARHGAMRSPMLMLVRLVKAGYLACSRAAHGPRRLTYPPLTGCRAKAGTPSATAWKG